MPRLRMILAVLCSLLYTCCFLSWASEVHGHDLHATILHLLGIDHERLIYRHGGRDYRLTDVGGNVVREILA